jgi:hypothetical protein|tara:strand:+ start:387 stop:617 length:231 start_codon:yes stop_codon:yes gene_type:complete
MLPIPELLSKRTFTHFDDPAAKVAARRTGVRLRWESITALPSPVFPDGATYGAFLDAIRTDEEWLALWADVFSGEQ